MPASEAQIRANQANAQKSTGPKTEEGKAVSRANSYKHGLTATTVLPEREMDEIHRRYLVYVQELNLSTEVEYGLALMASQCLVRVQRCNVQETASLTERVRRAEADFVPPEGASAEEIEKLRQTAMDKALFDPSKEACLARQYQASAERGYYRALKELRALTKERKAREEARIDEFERAFLGSSFEDDDLEAELAALGRKVALPKSNPAVKPVESDNLGGLKRRVDVPIAVGRRC